MSTYIDGIGASANIDSSGEIVDITGLDISSLEVDGTITWEHQKNSPDSLVGKILKAKKIFSIKDCDDDRQKYFWNKCQTPYLYIVAELFDEYTDSARTAAGFLRYDLDHRGKNANDVIGFSIEGATISKVGNVIMRSIARKVTLTQHPCNKQAVAEMVPKEGKKSKDNLDNIFKTESYVDIEIRDIPDKSTVWEMLKAESLMKKAKALFGKPMKKDIGAGGMSYGADTGLSGSAPSSPSLSCSEPDMGRSEKNTNAKLEKVANLKVVPPHSENGTKMGQTKSGADVFSHAKVGSYKAWGAQDHRDAGEMHKLAAQATRDPKVGQHHWNKSQLHHSASNTIADKRARTTVTPKMLAGNKKSEVIAPGTQGDSVKANQKQERVRRAQEAYPNNDKHHFDEHKIDHSESNPQNIKRASIPNKQISHKVEAAGGPSNNMLHNNILAPKRTMHKAAGGAAGGLGGGGSSAGTSPTGIGISSTNMIMDSSSSTPKPKKPKLGQITKSLEAGSGLAAPNALVGGAALAKESLDKKLHKGGAYSGNVPKDQKIKELQQKIDNGTYKPDSKAVASKMLNHKSKPLKKSEALQRAESEYASWEKREEFENFMKSRMPHMTKSEIKAFGQAMILNKSIKMEKSLNGLLGLLKEEPKK